MFKFATVQIRLGKSFRALGHRDFRYFWTGQCISLLGTWMQRTAQQWLVYSLTKSPFLLGILGVFQFGPMLLFSLFAGTLVDRFPKRRVLIFTQTVLMIQALILALLVWTGQIQYWQILILALVMGFVNTLDMPTRQSYFIELVGKDDLMNAIALNSAIVNIAKIVGPAIAGIVMLYLGTAICFFLNGISFIAVLIGLFLIRTSDTRLRAQNTKLLADVGEGLKYIASKPVLWSTVLAMFAVGTFAMNMDVLIPVFAGEVLHRQASGYGFLLAAMGIGSLVGALLVSTRSRRGLSAKILFGSAVIECLFYLVLGFVHHYELAMFFIAVIGFFSIIFMTTANSTVQLNSDDGHRGRVMSVYSLAFAGTTPIGNFFAGSVAEKMGGNFSFVACGAVTLACIVWILLKTKRHVNLVSGDFHNPDNLV
ncbi:MAG TPA: MFS transporter [Bacillota bacterium]